MKNITIITLLALVTLFAGCDLSFEPEKPALGNGAISQVQVTIGGNARTILPNLDEGFSKFVLSVESTDSQNPPPSVEVSAGNSYGTIPVPYGEWIITATAYVHVGGIDYPAAKGSTTLTVNSDYHSVTIIINLPESGGNGTFNYTVRYPSGGSAVVKLAPLGNGTPVFENSVSSDVPASEEVTGGIYFLTVATTVNSTTVTRSEIVHIYPHSTTNADYVFTKLDFGANSLNLSGTVKVLVNGVKPDQAYLWYSTVQNSWSTFIDFTGNDGSGTWSVSLSHLNGANTLYFRAGPFDSMSKELLSIPIPVDDAVGLDLGTVEFTVTSLPADTWIGGEIMTPVADWYSINVTQGTKYYFWSNSGQAGDGTKTLSDYFRVFYNNGNYIVGNSRAWYDPMSFTADYSGTVYIKVAGEWGNTGTYAIGYSTNSLWHNNSFVPANAVPLAAETWFDGEIMTPYASDLYSINVTEGTKYYVWLNNAYGDGTKTLSDYFVAFDNNGNWIVGEYSAWYNPMSFTADYTGTVYIRVAGEWGNFGDYAIGYSTNAYWHNNSLNPANAVPLPVNTWVDGEIMTPNASNLYSINVTQGATYYFWLNNAYAGDGTKTLYGAFEVFDSNGNYINGTSSAWHDPMSFTANYTGTVYIRMVGWGNTGTYAIKYSISNSTVTFDLNGGNIGGSTTLSSVEVTYGATLGAQYPVAPVRTDYVFDGWWSSGYIEYFNNTPVTSDNITLTARWVKPYVTGETYQIPLTGQKVWADTEGINGMGMWIPLDIPPDFDISNYITFTIELKLFNEWGDPVLPDYNAGNAAFGFTDDPLVTTGQVIAIGNSDVKSRWSPFGIGGIGTNQSLSAPGQNNGDIVDYTPAAIAIINNGNSAAYRYLALVSLTFNAPSNIEPIDFDLDLSNIYWGSSAAGEARIGTWDGTVLTFSFTDQDQRGIIPLTSDQIAVLQDPERNQVKITIVAEELPSSTDATFRWHLGNPNSGVDWNGTQGQPNGQPAALSSSAILENTVSITARNFDNLSHFILQQRNTSVTTDVAITKITLSVF